MSTSAARTQSALAIDVRVSDNAVEVELSDGRKISAPLAWFPRLLNATKRERNQWRVIGAGQGIHWPAIDQDISVENLLAGQPSGESQRSLQKWVEQRAAGRSARLAGKRIGS